MDPFKITYYQAEGNLPSLDIKNSDYSGNAIYAERLVGTLVKIRERGRFTPYLASEWNVADAGKIWRFTLHPGLTCEDGEKIDADGFVRSLKFSLKRYSELMGGKVPVFSKLKGWSTPFRDDFHGLRSDGGQVVFEFETPVKDGLLEFLSMPYYGYLCLANFGQDGLWKDSRRLVSSNSYRLAHWDDHDGILLEARPDWAILDPLSPKAILFKQNLSDIQASDKPAIIEYKSDKPFDDKKFTLVNSVPTWFYGYVLQDNGGGPFSKIKNRIALLNKIRELQPRIPMSSPRRSKSTYFYPAQQTALEKTHADEKPVIGSPIKIVTYIKPAGGNEYLETLLTQSLDALGIKYEIHRLDQSQPDFVRTLMDGPWDIRLQGVSIGGGAENWVVEMMFCSKMGAHLADPSGRICKMTKEFDRNEIPYDEYLKRFNNYIYEDAATIPVMHGSSAWLFSKDFDLSKLSASFTLISFEDLRLLQK